MSAAKNPQLVNAIKQGAFGLFIGDAVSMPVHWYYNALLIKDDFNGWITKYEQPKNIHPGTSGLTRPNPITYDGKEIYVIGDVLLKGKAGLYSPDNKATHYHQGTKAGDNTLNCYTALLVMRTLKACGDSASDEDITKQIFANYVKIMTTPDSHPDAFAESQHRTFFTDWVLAGSPTGADAVYKFATDRAEANLAKPSSADSAYIGSFTMPIPLVLHFSSSKTVDEVVGLTIQVYSRTHPEKFGIEAMDNFIRVLYSVVHGASLKDEAEKAFISFLGADGKSKLEKLDKMVEAAGSDKVSAFQNIGKELGLSCPVKNTYPTILYLARYFHDDFEGGILMNANVGGDNCGRAPPLGALLGAALGAKGDKIPAKWTDPLALKPVIDQLLSN